MNNTASGLHSTIHAHIHAGLSKPIHSPLLPAPHKNTYKQTHIALTHFFSYILPLSWFANNRNRRKTSKHFHTASSSTSSTPSILASSTTTSTATTSSSSGSFAVAGFSSLPGRRGYARPRLASQDFSRPKRSCSRKRKGIPFAECGIQGVGMWGMVDIYIYKYIYIYIYIYIY